MTKSFTCPDCVAKPGAPVYSVDGQAAAAEGHSMVVNGRELKLKPADDAAGAKAYLLMVDISPPYYVEDKIEAVFLNKAQAERRAEELSEADLLSRWVKEVPLEETPSAAAVQ